MPQNVSKARSLLIFAILTAALHLAGCSMIRPEPGETSGTIDLSQGSVLGQTFLGRYDGLQSVEVYIEPGGELVDSLNLKLTGWSEHERPSFREVEFAIPPGFEGGWLALPTPDPGSARQYFLLEVEVPGPGSLELGTLSGPGDWESWLYLNGEPQDGQLAFRPVYATGRAAWGLLGDGLGALGVLLLAGLAFVLPGWALLDGLDGGWEQRSGFERSILAAGVGLALYPVLLLWTHLAGLNLGPMYLWIPPLAGLAFILWKRARAGVGRPAIRLKLKPPDLFTAAVVALLAFSRLWPLRTLAVGMWGDSVHHTLITRLLLDHGGLFDAWQPYADLASFSYHFGFHTASALLAWASALITVERAVLWAGQLANLLAILALYPLARKFAAPWGERAAHWAGITALVVAGFVSPMPAFYVNWGRYTQVAGQAILPVWMALAVDAFQCQGRRWRTLSLQGLLLAGIGLTHYRVLIFAVLFVAAYWLVHVWRFGLLQAARRVFWVGVGGAFLFVPWLWTVYGGRLMAIIGPQLTTPASEVSQVIENYNQVGDLAAYLPPWVWWLLPVIVAWGIWKRQAGVVVMAAWTLLLALLANPGWLGLPGAGVVNNFAVLIAAYLPATVLVGLALGKAFQAIGSSLPARPGYARSLLGVLAVLALARGAVGQVRLVRPQEFALVTRPDLQAAAWIRQNTDPDALFLVNAFIAGSGTTVAGGDAGWWLPDLAGRKVTLPPFIYIAEQNLDPDYRVRILELTAAVNEKGAADPQVIEMLADWGVTHVYIGQLQGSVNSSGQSIDPGSLQASPAYEVVYHQDRVWVFGLQP